LAACDCFGLAATFLSNVCANLSRWFELKFDSLFAPQKA